MIRLTSLLTENAFDQALEVWSKSVDSELVEKFIDTFKILKSRNIISGEQSDISYWSKRPFQHFQAFIYAYEKVYKDKVSDTKTSKNAEKIFENTFVVVIVPNTHEASIKYGSGTKWCISGRSDGHWDNYMSYGVKFYFVISKILTNKQSRYKIAVAVSPHTKGESPVLDIYDSEDGSMDEQDFDNYCDEYSIPKSIFTNIQ